MTVAFRRLPAPSPGVREVLVEAGGGVVLSGLLAEPAGGASPRGLIAAIHGFGVHAGYFDATTGPGLSLLGLGAELGFAVLALDRPGCGASADLPETQLTMRAQADLLINAVDGYAAENPIGGGVLLVAHSYAAGVAWVMVADPRCAGLLGVDVSGSGVRHPAPVGGVSPFAPRPRAAGDRGLPWGPSALYPPNSFTRGVLPVMETPAARASGSSGRGDGLGVLGPQIRVPVRLTFGEHERYWSLEETHFAEIGRLLPNVPSFSVEILRHAAHNLSLGYAARSYHLRVVAFAEACLLARALA